MKVKAISLGYYDHVRRRPGDVFDIEKKEQFSLVWMEPLDAEGEAHAEAMKAEKIQRAEIAREKARQAAVDAEAKKQVEDEGFRKAVEARKAAIPAPVKKESKGNVKAPEAVKPPEDKPKEEKPKGKSSGDAEVI